MNELLLVLILIVSFARWWMMIRIVAQKSKDPLWYAMREMYVIPVIEIKRTMHTFISTLKERY